MSRCHLFVELDVGEYRVHPPSLREHRAKGESEAGHEHPSLISLLSLGLEWILGPLYSLGGNFFFLSRAPLGSNMIDKQTDAPIER